MSEPTAFPRSRERLEDLTVGKLNGRNLFHICMNHDRNYARMGEVKAWVDEAFAIADEYMTTDRPESDFPSHFTFVPYDRAAVDAKVEGIYRTLWNHKYVEWMENGMNTKYNPLEMGGGMWWADSFDALRVWLLQRAPFNLTDGVWLRQALPTGPIDAAQAELFSVYIDELGNGSDTQNHCNCFMEVLHAVGYVIPDVKSREFADMKGILDASFTKPAFVAAASLFSSQLEAEIIGFTMWLEITSPCEHAAVAKLLEQYGLDPTFSLLHTAIDNFEAGHGRVAMSVCHAYLDRIRRTQGEQAVQEAWRRVWRGYTAYGVIGDMFTPLRTHLLKNPARPIQDFTDLIANKARFGAGQHGFIKIQGKPIDEYFAKPREFMDALVRANYVEPGDPWRSTFINRLIRFDGPMYQIFDTDEINVINRWILSLRPKPELQMYNLIKSKSRTGSRKHGSRTLEVGGKARRMDVLINDPIAFMQGLINSGYTSMEDGDPESSDLMRSMQNPNGQMSKVFIEEDLQVMRDWLGAGCPIPAEEPPRMEVVSTHRFIHKM